MSVVDVVRILGTASIGAVSGAAVTYYRARVQVIRYESDVLMIGVMDSRTLAITVEDLQGNKHYVPRFFITTKTLTDRSNKDLDQYEFGITLPFGLTAIEDNFTKPDRKHSIEKVKDSAIDKEPPPETIEEGHSAFEKALERLDQPIEQEMDFIVKPFNRGTSYRVNMTVVPMVIDGGYFRQDTDAILYEEQLAPAAAVLGMALPPRRFMKLRTWLKSRIA